MSKVYRVLESFSLLMFVCGNSGVHLSSNSMEGSIRNDRVGSISSTETFPRNMISNADRDATVRLTKGTALTSTGLSVISCHSQSFVFLKDVAVTTELYFTSLHRQCPAKHHLLQQHFTLCLHNCWNVFINRIPDQN